MAKLEKGHESQATGDDQQIAPLRHMSLFESMYTCSSTPETLRFPLGDNSGVPIFYGLCERRETGENSGAYSKSTSDATVSCRSSTVACTLLWVQ